MTNRDKINALSNIELAGFLGRDGTNCSLCIYRGKGCRDKSCAFGIKAWLGTPCKDNPPADNPFANVDRTTKWMPKNGEEYVIPEISRGYPSWEDFVWNGTLRDKLRYESGIVCRGAGEALKLAEKMLAVAKKESEQHD